MVSGLVEGAASSGLDLLHCQEEEEEEEEEEEDILRFDEGTKGRTNNLQLGLLVCSTATRDRNMLRERLREGTEENTGQRKCEKMTDTHNSHKHNTHNSKEK